MRGRNARGARTLQVGLLHSPSEAKEFQQLVDSIRNENKQKGFLSDDEINAEILAYRNEKQQAKVWVEKNIPMPDESDRIFYDTDKQSGSILITGNTKHFPDEPFIMTPAEFMRMMEDT